MKRDRIQIEGMSCVHCVAAVRAALEDAGVSVVDATVGEAEVRYDDMVIDRSKIDGALASAGYRVVAHDPVDDPIA